IYNIHTCCLLPTKQATRSASRSRNDKPDHERPPVPRRGGVRQRHAQAAHNLGATVVRHLPRVQHDGLDRPVGQGHADLSAADGFLAPDLVPHVQGRALSLVDAVIRLLDLEDNLCAVTGFVLQAFEVGRTIGDFDSEFPAR
ncbi:unnamed protein product, partial [Heterosigma akashiwo]